MEKITAETSLTVSSQKNELFFLGRCHDVGRTALASKSDPVEAGRMERQWNLPWVGPQSRLVLQMVEPLHRRRCRRVARAVARPADRVAGLAVRNTSNH